MSAAMPSRRDAGILILVVALIGMGCWRQNKPTGSTLSTPRDQSPTPATAPTPPVASIPTKPASPPTVKAEPPKHDEPKPSETFGESAKKLDAFLPKLWAEADRATKERLELLTVSERKDADFQIERYQRFRQTGKGVWSPSDLRRHKLYEFLDCAYIESSINDPVFWQVGAELWSLCPKARGDRFVLDLAKKWTRFEVIEQAMIQRAIIIDRDRDKWGPDVRDMVLELAGKEAVLNSRPVKP